MKEPVIDNRNRLRQRKNEKKYSETHKDKRKEAGRKYYQTNKSKINEKNRNYYLTHTDEIKKNRDRYYNANKDKIAERCRRYGETHREEMQRYYQEYRKTHKTQAKEYRYKKKYAITIGEIEDMRMEQGGKCKMCGDSQRELIVEHNHKTGKVRGLVCKKCNAGLGAFNDSIENLLGAVSYLREND